MDHDGERIKDDEPGLEGLRSTIEAAVLRRVGMGAHAIRVSVSTNVVTLSGHAERWQTVQAAVRAVQEVAGAAEINDFIRLRSQP